MTHYLFNHYDLIVIGIVLCAFMALIIAMLAKFTCQNKRAELQPPKEEKHLSGYRSEKTIPAKAPSFEEIIEELKKTPKGSPGYQTRFFVSAGITARTGKSVYIRKAHHDKIMKIIQVIGNNETTIFSYIDNVLNHHFETFQDEIEELYDKNIEKIF